jgi:NitT/TauT family transport system substrate-binding protein
MRMFPIAIVCLLFVQLNLQAETIKVGSSPVVSSAGLYLAKERNYFKDLGLDVDIIDFNNSGAQMTALLSKGELDVGAGNLSSGLFNAILKGQKFKLVADKGHLETNKDYIALIVRLDHLTSGRYKTLENLKGFKIGLTSLDGVSQQIVMDRFLIKAGLKSTDVEYVKLSYAEMNVALRSKSIDATIQIEPYLTKAELDGIAKIVANATDVYPNQQSGAIIYSPQFIKNKPKVAMKFMVAYLKGVRDYNQGFVAKKNKDKVIADLKKYIKIEDDKVWNNMRPVGLSENGSIDSKALINDIRWYVSKKYIEKFVALEDLVDDQFAIQATKESQNK